MNLLPLKHQSVFTQNTFCLSSSNEHAHKIVMMWPQWTHPVAVFFGPSGVGKSHLGRIWAQKSNASIIHADDPWPDNPQHLLIEEAHLLVASPSNQYHFLKGINAMLEEGDEKKRGSVLLLSKTPPAYWSLEISDLTSRLKSATVIAIVHPDAPLLRMVAKKIIKERQLAMSEQALSYLLTQVERSLSSVCLWIERLDQASLEQSCPVSVEMIKDIITQYHHKTI